MILFRTLGLSVWGAIWLKLGRLNWHARDCDWLSEEQHGFLAGKSTETATHSLTSFVENGFSVKHFSAAAFLDIKSAFDSAWPMPLLVLCIKDLAPNTS
jgi:hypothetical protein